MSSSIAHSLTRISALRAVAVRALSLLGNGYFYFGYWFSRLRA